MGAAKGILVRLRALVRGRAADRELEEEIQFHLEQATRKNVGRGMSVAEARRHSLATFGGVRRVQEEHRDVRGARWLEDFIGDTRYAVRTLRRSPALTGAAVLTLALGVGANTAIFSVVNAVVLRPLPFQQPDRLVMLWEENPEKGWKEEVAAPANMLDWKAQVAAFTDIAAFTDGRRTVTLTGDGAPQRLGAAEVTGNFFSVLGVRAQLGRTFRDEESWATHAQVVVISHRTWQDRFGGDPRIIGRIALVDHRDRQIVGVMPPGFSFPFEAVDFWIPSAWDPNSRTQEFFRRAHWLRPIARVRPGVSVEQANVQLQEVVNRLKQQYPRTNRFMGAGLTPLQEFLVGDTRQPLLVLLGAVALLLLIACANVGNLLLVQAAGRAREVALRLALGAGKGRIVRQAFAESLVLAIAGGLAGLALGWAGTRAVMTLQPEGLLRVTEFGVDRLVVSYVIAITMVSALMFGTLPALWSGQRPPGDALKAGGRSGSDNRRMRRWGDGLAVGEVALSLLLTIGAGLLVRSFWELQRVNPGFDPAGVITMSLEIPVTRYDTGDKIQAFFEELERRARALPGVVEAGLTTNLSLTGSSTTSDFTVAGRAPGEYGTEMLQRDVTPGYTRAMRVPLIRGRSLQDEDRRGAPLVIVINDALAHSYFRGQDPIGQRIAFDKVPDSTSTWFTVVGVLGSERQRTLALAPRIETYFPFAQDPSSAMTLVTRVRGEPTSVAPSLRRLVAEMDPTLAIASMRTMDAVRATSVARERFLMVLLLVFAGVGLSLAVVGVYGVLAHLARHRRREMGIRIALGAPLTQVQWLVVRHGLRLVWLGLALGTVGALAATRTVRTLLYGVAPSDPATFFGVAAVLTLTGLLASWIPARSASRADPSEALRGDG